MKNIFKIQFNLQTIVKIYHLQYADDYFWLLNFIQLLYDMHAKTTSPTRAEYLRKCGLFTEWLFKFLATMFTMACMLYFFMMIYMYAMENELVPLIPLYLPGVDENTIAGYSILMIYQATIFLFGIPGFVACEFLLEIIIISSLIFGKLIALDTEHVNNDLANGMTRNATYRLKNVLAMRQEMVE